MFPSARSSRSVTNSPDWANLQIAYDLTVAERDIGERIAAEVRVPPAA
jgi:plasmid maintenance system antidote protein VapI